MSCCRLKGRVVEVISPPREPANKTPLSPPGVTPVNGVSPTVVSSSPMTLSPVGKPALVVLERLPELAVMDSGSLSSSREEDEVLEVGSTANSSKTSVTATPKAQKKKVPKSPICEAAALEPSLYRYRVEVCDVSGTSVVELPGASVR